jgi:hypothetical protein
VASILRQRSILGSEFRGTRDHILLSQIRDFPFLRLLRLAEQSRTEQSSSLLPAASQHGHSWHRAPLGPMAIYLFSVKTFVFFSFFLCSSFDNREGLGSFFHNWCSLTTPHSTRGHIKVGDIYILYIFTKHKLTLI